MADADEADGAVDEEFAHRQVQGEAGAVLAPTLDFAAGADDAGLAGAQVPLEVVIVVLGMFRRHQHRHVSADHLGAAVTEQTFGGTVERGDDALGVDRDDAVHGSIRQRGELRVRDKTYVGGHGAFTPSM